MAPESKSTAPPGASLSPDTDPGGPLSDLIENLLSEVIVAGLHFPITCAILASNRSAVVVEYQMTAKVDVLMVCGHVQPGGYQLPVLALFSDRTHQAVLALIDTAGGSRLLYRPA